MTSQLAALSHFASSYASLFQRLRLQWATAGQAVDHAAAGDAAAVRALADSYRRSDPGFASDLYAAAERHERALEAAAGALSPRPSIRAARAPGSRRRASAAGPRRGWPRR